MLTSVLMLFFNQVVGLPAAWVGAAIMVTLIVDAICDPLIGEWSDHTRSRWGRRHPFMYASAVPAAAAFYFLFDPPLGWSRSSLLIYMAAMLVTVRVLLSLYEIPSSALGPELTYDYDQRTSLVSSRFFFGTLGGAAISVLALQVFLRKDATHPLGLLNRAGYGETALVAGIAIFLSIMISCLGTHRFIASVIQEPKVRGTWREKLGEIRETSPRSRPGSGRDSTSTSRRISGTSRPGRCPILRSSGCSPPLPESGCRRQSPAGSARSAQ
jgi:glycoside/pentoside/hexuronide:cation symporter, GPH family